MKNYLYFILLWVLIISTSISSKLIKSNSSIVLGAYYFDGWTGTYPYHITKKLIDSFPERQPKWGWVTSKQKVIDEQIKLASKVGLSFFSFCWYYRNPTNFNSEPLNNALRLYKKSSQKSKLKYCLMVTNHSGFEIGPKDWDFVTQEWVSHFKDKQSYLTVEGKPLIIFFSVKGLLDKFITSEKVDSALNVLRKKSIQQGLNGVTIACCMSKDTALINLSEKCGFDILTGYNYHYAGYTSIRVNNTIPIQSLLDSERKIWNGISRISKLKYIPLSTLNWDPRPWGDGTNWYSKEPHYIGFSPTSVYNSVRSCMSWIQESEEFTTKEKIAILYAWNENGEGAWLTPGKGGFNPSEGIKKAFK